MKCITSLVGAVGFIVVSAGPILASSVGLFYGDRGNLGFAGPTSWETLLTGQGHDVSRVQGSIVGQLEDKDVVITGLLNVSGGVSATSPGAARTGEIAALTEWLTGGGTFVITGENLGFAAVYNTWLNPFGVNLSGQHNNFNEFAAFSGDPTDPYLSNGIVGQSIPISNRGWYDLLPPEANTLAGNQIRPFVFELAVGAGSIIGIADTQFLKEQYNNAGRTFLFNVAEFAPGYDPVSTDPDTNPDVSPVPLPASMLLMFSSLFGLGVLRSKKHAA